MISSVLQMKGRVQGYVVSWAEFARAQAPFGPEFGVEGPPLLRHACCAEAPGEVPLQLIMHPLGFPKWHRLRRTDGHLEHHRPPLHLLQRSDQLLSPAKYLPPGKWGRGAAWSVECQRSGKSLEYQLRMRRPCLTCASWAFKAKPISRLHCPQVCCCWPGRATCGLLNRRPSRLPRRRILVLRAQPRELEHYIKGAYHCLKGTERRAPTGTAYVPVGHQSRDRARKSSSSPQPCLGT